MAFERLRVGELRPSQVIHTFGIGSILDLPNFSAMVMGLEAWEPPTPQTEIVEDRLLGLVRNHLGPQVEHLVAPPTVGDAGFDPLDPETRKGIPVTPFPGWVRCPVCDLIAPLDCGLFSLKKDYYRPDRTRFVHDNCPKAHKPPGVVPVRFVVVCEQGHIGDFPWVEYVHGGPTNCKSVLRLREFGVSAEAADISVKCDTCGVARKMTQAFGEQGEKSLGPCRGQHPHLRHVVDGCKSKPKAMLSGASNLWFPVNVSALSIPATADRLDQLCVEHWPVLQHVASREILTAFRKAGQLGAFAEWDDDRLWRAIEQRRAGALPETRPAFELKSEEWEVFSKGDPNRNGPDFRLVAAAQPPGHEGRFEKIVLVERLRVVKALTGFTRIISPGDFADPSEIPEIRRVPLARKRPEWVPASEVRGEGVFLQFREVAIQKWLAEKSVGKRDAKFASAHVRFRQARKIEQPERNYPGIRYVLLHSLAHALIRQFAVECGYGAASIQERIYARDPGGDEEPMAGILLYTAAADSEGTLGGLVGLGQPKTLARHLDQALEDMRLCASDPLCSEHDPSEDGITLHGAACHACMFASETSCERGNKYLDRALLVQTIGGDPAPFFDEPGVGG
jgi:hypothetical protein